MPIAKLEPVPLREVWKHEAQDFTIWMAENLDFISDAIGVDLAFVEREKSAGDFSVDILAEAGDGDLVVIENQLERTDHDHLGKLITYMSNLDAKIAVWITSHPRPEHEKAVQWLNETLPADTGFFLIRVEAYRIENSPPAPLFTLVAGPSQEARQIGTKKKEWAERDMLRLKFWEDLQNRLRGQTKLHTEIKPSKASWLGMGAGRGGLGYNYVILIDKARIELYIDTGNAEANQKIFEELLSRKDEIEKVFGEPLDWQALERRRACRIAYHMPGVGLKDEEAWPELQDRMIDAMIRFEKAFRPWIKRLRT